MKSRPIAGIVLSIVGAVVLIMGLNASDSAADQLTKTFTGHFTDTTSMYILGGLAALIAGLGMSAWGSRASTI